MDMVTEAIERVLAALPIMGGPAPGTDAPATACSNSAGGCAPSVETTDAGDIVIKAPGGSVRLDAAGCVPFGWLWTAML